MTKVKGYIQARAPQLKDLRAMNTKGDEQKIKDEQREVAVALLEDKAKRNLSKTEQRNHDRAIMAKSLVNYPKNPMPRAGVWNAADHVNVVRSAPKSEAGKPKSRKHVDGNNDVHPRIAKANRKQAQAAARQLAKEERKAAKEARKALRIAARAERALTRDARKAERAEARRLANMPTIEVTKAMQTAVLDVVQTQFNLTERQLARQGKILARLAKIAPKKLHNRSKQLEIRIALLQGLKLEIDAEAKAQADAEAQGAADNKQGKEAVKQAKGVAVQPKKKVVAKKQAPKPQPKVVAKGKAVKRVSYK